MGRLTRLGAAAAAALALCVQPVGAEPWGGDLTKEADVTLLGAPGDGAGISVAGAGDVNGDGLRDMIVGAPSGFDRAYVVFGRAFPRVVRLADIGEPGNMDGFLIYNGDEGYAYSLGSSVAAAGDVNRDGLDDVIVGSPETYFHGIPDDETGAAHVIFGKAAYDTVNVRQLGAGGFEIRGPRSDAFAGSSVAGVGDMNRDGYADVAVSAHKGRGGYPKYSGAAYVVFGKPTAEPVELAALGNGGFKIIGSHANEQAGNAVAGAGDVNGDQVPDLIVGAAEHDRESGSGGGGAAYIIFGKSTSEQVDLARLGDQGFLIEGYYRTVYAGWAVAGVGDMNGDGLDDVAVGDPHAGYGGTDTGYAYVVFGKRSTGRVDLGDLGDQGFSVRGARPEDKAGWAMAGAGDVDGDAVPDLVIGSPTGSPLQPGKAYVVFGKSSSEPIDLAERLGKRGFRFEGEHTGDWAGSAVAGPGDLDQDGHGEVMVGAPRLHVDGSGGGAFVLYGLKQPTLHYEPVVGTVGVPIEGAAPSGIRTGDASFRVSLELPEGLALDRQTGAVSGTPVRTQAESAHTVTVTDWVGTAKAPLAISIKEAPSSTQAPPPTQVPPLAEAPPPQPRSNRLCISPRSVRRARTRRRLPGGMRLGLAMHPRRGAVDPRVGAGIAVRASGDARARRQVRAVRFWVDGTRRLTATARPYRFTWPVDRIEPGRHVVKAEVVSTRGSSIVLKLDFAARRC